MNSGFNTGKWVGMLRIIYSTTDEHIDNHKGLGLYIVKIITDFHDARITISNKPDGGALVELTFKKTGVAE